MYIDIVSVITVLICFFFHSLVLCTYFGEKGWKQQKN